MDHRRYGFPQTRNAFGRRAASVLRATRQGGQLSGGGVAVDCKPLRQPAGGLSAIPAEGLGRRQGAPGQGRRAIGYPLQDQAGDRARASPMGVRGQPATRGRIDGRRLWHGLAAAHRHDGVGSELCRWHSAENPGVATRYWTEAEGQAAEQYGASRRTRSDLGQTDGARSSQACLRTIRWREGSAEWLSSRFARVRVRVAHNQLMPELLSQEWLLIEWPEGDTAPTKYWLSTLPANISFRELVDFAKLRWRIERDYQELKQEVGLGHFEGRGWRGFHHHATMCIAAYGFLISERETIPPSRPRRATLLQTSALPSRYRPRGSPLAA